MHKQFSTLQHKIAYIFGKNIVITYNQRNSCEEVQPEKWQKVGISAGIEELVHLLESRGNPISPGKEALKTVEVIIGFLESQRQENSKVTVPVPR